MKQFFQKPILSIFFFFFISHFSVTKADTASDAETILNWAENTYPGLFPSHQATQNINPWIFRHYTEAGIYAGVNQNDNGVYVFGGPWERITFIDTLPNVVNLALNSGNNNISACDTSFSPTGISYSQSGNVVTITTNGQCLPAPDLSDPTSANLCQPPIQPTATGISVLSSNEITSSAIEGITTDSMTNPFESILAATANVKYCSINTPASAADIVVNSDLCFDITELLSSLPSIEGVTITPPVKYHFAGTSTSTSVPDCFATDASAIFDAVTGDVWIKNSLTGEFVQATN